jgi:hypothetical protein
MEFLSLPGQERTRRRDEFLGGLLNYYLGPTGIPERLGLMDMMNQASDVGRSMTSSQEMLSPGRTPRERLNAGVSMVTDLASIAVPGIGTRMAGGDEAAAVAESLLGFGGQTRQGLDDATRRFLADESGALTLPGRAVGPAEERGQQIVNMLTSGRAGDITEDMLDLGDPVMNARLNQYLFENYDLPMDEASRMARAQQMEAGPSNWIHTTLTDDGDDVFQYFDPPRYNDPDVWLTKQNALEWKAHIDDMAKHRATGDDAPTVLPLRVLGPESSQNWRKSAEDLYEEIGLGGDVNLSDLSDGDLLEALQDAYPAPARGVNIFENYPDFDNIRIDMGRAAPENIRSRFARFDPRLAHLRNLSAGVGGLGLLAIPQEEQ